MGQRLDREAGVESSVGHNSSFQPSRTDNHRMTSQTAIQARGMARTGLLYQRRALQVLPVLVRQAAARETIFYGELAREVGISNARTLNWVLGAVGTSLNALGREWRQPIPRIQALVVNRHDKLPGAGFMDAFVEPAVLKHPNRQLRRRVVQTMLDEVFSYSRWNDVLAHFDMAPVPSIPIRLLDAASNFSERGESEAHRALKEYIAAHPKTVGLSLKPLRTVTEYRLPSGDAVDVLFQTRRFWLAVEVKSRISAEDDLVRGVFQCVKYEAVLDAVLRTQAVVTDVAVVLAVEASLTDHTRRLATTLGVDVREQVGGSVLLADAQ